MYAAKTDGVVIRSYDFGEGHRIVVIFTRALGKVKAVAKGSRKTKSKFGSSLEPLTENSFLLYKKPNRELFTVTGCSILNSNAFIRDKMELFAYGAAMIEGIDLLCEEEDYEPVIYELLKAALSDMHDKNPSSTAWLFLFRLLKYAGYRLNFFNCVSCSSKEVENLYFSPLNGGIVCKGCRSKDSQGWRVSSEAVSAVRKLSPDRPLSAKAEKEIGNIIKKFIKYQFNKDFRSLGFLYLFKEKKNVFSGINTQA